MTNWLKKSPISPAAKPARPPTWSPCTPKRRLRPRRRRCHGWPHQGRISQATGGAPKVLVVVTRSTAHPEDARSQVKVLVGIPGRLKMGTMSSMSSWWRTILASWSLGGNFQVISGVVISAQFFWRNKNWGNWSEITLTLLISGLFHTIFLSIW